ncbi:MAG: serine/threonine protein kinase [Thermoanaerobaculia bacterium]|nr:serine/threonine protein kinase [Thermoanaerobaculia bacterium]
MSGVPQEIAGYRVVRTLGRGGAGTVYLAEQDEPVKRQVALKVLRQTVTDDESSARFLAERHAMGRLDHPNVGRILEAGEDDLGRPFFAMEWLDGLRLDHYCEQHRSTIAERLRIFQRICRGVAHAHQKQLLHRDLKPSNVLVIEVDGEPVPKVIDFGVAKALDQPLGGVDLKTQHVLGTPIYTSPEGLKLREVDIDTRSDVYSLGVLLCELLVGRRPHELGDGALGSFLRRKAEEDPAPPSDLLDEIPDEERRKIAAARRQRVPELHKKLRGDLGWIVLKAVARRRSGRYASVVELAADVERCLHSKPIQARPPSVSYSIGKFVGRHRTAVVLAATIAVAILIGMAGLATGLHRARLAEARSNAEATAARLERDQAEAVSAFLSELFRDAAINSPRVGGGTNAIDLSADELVERGVQRATESLAGQPDALMRVQATIGDIYYAWGRFSAARFGHEAALRLAKTVQAPAVQEADIRIALGADLLQLQELDEADDQLNSALQLLRSCTAVSAEDRSSLGNAEVRALVLLARLARSRDDEPRTREFLEQARAVLASSPKEDLDDLRELARSVGLEME